MQFNKTNNHHHVNNGFSGYVGASTGIFVTHPLDTLKTNIQISKNNKSIFQIAKQIYNRPRGIFSFYAGVMPPVFFRGFGFGANQFVFTYLKKNNFSTMFSGITAGMVMALVDNPVILVKTRAQGGKLRIRENIFSYLRAMKEIKQKESFRGLYSGFGARFMTQGLGFGVFYVFYDHFVFEKNWSSFSAGCIASVPSWICCYPFEGIVSRQMMNSNKFLKKYFCLKNQLKHLEWRNSYRGISICLLRGIPRFGITMLVTEKCKSLSE